VFEAIIDTLLAVADTLLPILLIVVSTCFTLFESAIGADNILKTLSIGLKFNNYTLINN
jgi:hypothetical protein